MHERAASTGISVVEKPLLGNALIDIIRHTLEKQSGI